MAASGQGRPRRCKDSGFGKGGKGGCKGYDGWSSWGGDGYGNGILDSRLRMNVHVKQIIKTVQFWTLFVNPPVGDVVGVGWSANHNEPFPMGADLQFTLATPKWFDGGMVALPLKNTVSESRSRLQHEDGLSFGSFFSDATSQQQNVTAGAAIRRRQVGGNHQAN